jgi:hypothetical protein
LHQKHVRLFGYEEGLTEYCHSVFSCDEPEDTVKAKMEHEKFREAIDRLPNAQRMLEEYKYRILVTDQCLELDTPDSTF